MPAGVESSRAALRLFIALWPDAAAREALAAWQRGWIWPDRAAVVPPERLHLTLHFLGNVPAQQLPALTNALRVPGPSFRLEFGQPAIWPQGIAVVRPWAVPAELMSLHADLAQCVSGFGLPLDERTYRPHVTLARRAAGARPPPAPRLPWRAEGYALVRSLPGGAGYRVLERFG